MYNNNGQLGRVMNTEHDACNCPILSFGAVVFITSRMGENLKMVKGGGEGELVTGSQFLVALRSRQLRTEEGRRRSLPMSECNF